MRVGLLPSLIIAATCVAPLRAQTPVVVRAAHLIDGVGTDAVAGAHGRNAEDLVCRVQSAGEDPMHALVSATSVNAEALGLADVIGRVAPGFAADLIATDADPSRDITAIRGVSFVMIGGRIVRNDGSPPR